MKPRCVRCDRKYPKERAPISLFCIECVSAHPRLISTTPYVQKNFPRKGGWVIERPDAETDHNLNPKR